MSSKSRKQSEKKSKSRPQGTQAGAGAAGGKGGAAAAEKDHEGLLDIPDEILHAPKEVSKLRYAMMIGLVVFLLIIFSIPGALLGGAGGAAMEDPVSLRWDVPGLGLQEMTGSEFQAAYRGLDDAVEFDPFLGWGLGLTGTRGPTPEDAARILVIDSLARHAGIRITEPDLVDHLTQLRDFVYQKDNDLLAARMRAYPDVEKNLRLGLRVQRFLRLAGFAGGAPTPQSIEEAWHEEHAEVRLDFIVADAAEYEEAARSELPDDEALEAWFEEKPDWERSALFLPEKRGLEVALFTSLDATPAAGLLAAFPPAEETAEPVEGEEPPTAEERAQEYYNKVFTRRFRVPEETNEAGETVAAHFLDLEEVEEQCLAEAPVEAALQAWLSDLQQRQGAGEEIDFAAEATAHGLEFRTVAPDTQEAFREDANLGDGTVVNALFATPVGGFAYALAATPASLAVVRVTEREEATLPPFAEIRDEVAEMWVEPRAQEMATEALEAIREGFETYTPEEDDQLAAFGPRDRRQAEAEAFRAAVENAGHELQQRDWFDRGVRTPPAGEEEEDPHALFFQSNAHLARMDLGEVGEPTPGGDRNLVYLVRMADERPVPIERMSPGDYERFRTQARNAAGAQLTSSLDLDFLEANFGLERPGWNRGDEEEEEASEEEAAAPAEGGSAE